MIDGKCSLCVTTRNRNLNLRSMSIDVCDAQSGSFWNSLKTMLGSARKIMQ